MSDESVDPYVSRTNIKHFSFVCVTEAVFVDGWRADIVVYYDLII